MNTEGHHSVADTAGIPLLQSVFGSDKKSLEALYLGNWLTDVSQAVDPVAYWAGTKKLKGIVKKTIDNVRTSVDGLLAEMLSTIYKNIPLPKGAEEVLKSLKPDLEPFAKVAIESLYKKIDLLVLAQSDERDSKLGRFFRSTFLIIGYFKFVHPEYPGHSSRLDFNAYMKVFGRPDDTRGSFSNNPATDRPGAYTQYYPHEHLDRPECLPPQDPPIFAPGVQNDDQQFQVAQGKKSGTRSPNKKERIQPDIYSYLRDNIEMIAGLLAEVDLEFEQKIKEYKLNGDSLWRDNDSAWYLTLAKLGHALHQVEDFFAHSNWVELAVKSQGQKFINKVVRPNTPIEVVNRANTMFRKRLKRHLTKPLEDWNDHPEEDWVVTGYFDFQDTLISLAHITEEIWGGHVPDPFAEGYEFFQSAKEAVEKPKTTLYKVQRIIQNTLDFITNPKKAIEDDENSVAQSLKDKFEPDVKNLLRPEITRQVAEQVISETIFKDDIPNEIKAAFLNMIIEGTRGHAGLTLYEVIKDISEFFANPIAWLKDWLPRALWDKVKDALIFYGKERVYDWLGADRIGCHSLLAKDHGYEPLFEQQKGCAIAVHWYIVNTLLRWDIKEDQKYIDWIELLEYFLRNPLPPEKGSFSIEKGFLSGYKVYKTERGDKLFGSNRELSLEHKFKPTAMDRDKFSWRSIADANFATKDLPPKKAKNVINSTLRERAWGVPVKRRPNFAFKPGIKIWIPEQKIPAIFIVPSRSEPTWFHEVMEKGWEVFRGYEDPDNMVTQPPLQHHSPINIDQPQLKAIILKGKKLRREARERYRPNVTSRCP